MDSTTALCSVSPPGVRRNCSEVRPSPWSAASTYGESASSALADDPARASGAGRRPRPTNAACVRTMKSPVSLRHAKWNSSRAAHMLVPAPAIV